MPTKTKTKTKFDTLTVQSKELNHVIPALMRVVPQRPSHPILTNLLVDLTADGVNIAAFDLSVSLQMGLVSSYSGEPRKICVNAKMLADILPHLNAEVQIQIDVDASQLLISSGRSKFKIGFQDAEQYAELPTIEGESFKLDPVVVGKVAKLIPFVSNEESKQLLTGVHVKRADGGLKVGATNGHMLAFGKLECDCPELEFTLPAWSRGHVAALDLLDRISKDDASIECKLDAPVQAQFEGDGWVMSARLLEGQYPNYQQIIPVQFAHIVEVNKTELKAAVEACKVVVERSRADLVRLAFSTDALKVYVTEDGVGDCEQILDSNFAGDDFELALNAKYLLQILTLVDGDSITLKMNTSRSPVVVSGTGEFDALIMPIQVRD